MYKWSFPFWTTGEIWTFFMSSFMKDNSSCVWLLIYLYMTKFPLVLRERRQQVEKPTWALKYHLCIGIFAGFCGQWTLKNQGPKLKVFLKCSPPRWLLHIPTPDADSLTLFCSVLQNLTVLPLWIPGIRRWGDRVAWSGLSGKSWERRQNCPAADQWEQNLDMRSWSMESTWCLAPGLGCAVHGDLPLHPGHACAQGQNLEVNGRPQNTEVTIRELKW